MGTSKTWMTSDEIYKSYTRSNRDETQIKILAQLNDVKAEVIREIIEEAEKKQKSPKAIAAKVVNGLYARYAGTIKTADIEGFYDVHAIHDIPKGGSGTLKRIPPLKNSQKGTKMTNKKKITEAKAATKNGKAKKISVKKESSKTVRGAVNAKTDTKQNEKLNTDRLAAEEAEILLDIASVLIHMAEIKLSY